MSISDSSIILDSLINARDLKATPTAATAPEAAETVQATPQTPGTVTIPPSAAAAEAEAPRPQTAHSSAQASEAAGRAEALAPTPTEAPAEVRPDPGNSIQSTRDKEESELFTKCKSAEKDLLELEVQLSAYGVMRDKLSADKDSVEKQRELCELKAQESLKKDEIAAMTFQVEEYRTALKEGFKKRAEMMKNAVAAKRIQEHLDKESATQSVNADESQAAILAGTGEVRNTDTEAESRMAHPEVAPKKPRVADGHNGSAGAVDVDQPPKVAPQELAVADGYNGVAGARDDDSGKVGAGEVTAPASLSTGPDPQVAPEEPAGAVDVDQRQAQPDGLGFNHFAKVGAGEKTAPALLSTGPESPDAAGAMDVEQPLEVVPQEPAVADGVGGAMDVDQRQAQPDDLGFNHLGQVGAGEETAPAPLSTGPESPVAVAGGVGVEGESGDRQGLELEGHGW